MRNKFTSLAFVFLFVVYLVASFSKRSWTIPHQSPICWDGFGYYFYLPTFFYDDFRSFKQYDYIQTQYAPTEGGGLGVKKASNGNLIMRYPIGASFLYFPGFIAGHIYAKAAGYPVDGLSMPYQFTMSMWTILFGMLGLWVLSRLLLRYYDDSLVAVSLLSLGIASNVYAYTAHTQLHTHIYLFTVYACILWLTDTFYLKEKHNYFLVMLIGLLCGLATICRPTEAISALIPLLWQVSDWNSLKVRISIFIKDWKVPILFMVMVFVGLSPLLLYWKIYSGQWLFYSYDDDQTFSFLHPHTIDFLFSYKKGWFTYTPIMYVAMFGFSGLWKYKRNIFVPVFVFFVINLYLISSWDCWWYGGSFSQRAIIQCYPLLMFPFTEFVLWVSKNKYRIVGYFAMLTFCTWLNLLMTYQAFFTDVMESNNMTKAYFWRIFGKTSVSTLDRKLLDTDEEMPESLVASLQLIYQTSYEDSIGNNETFAHTGKKSIQIGNEINYAGKHTLELPSKDVKWIRAKVMVYFPYMEWNVWKWAQFTLVLKNKAGREKYISIRAQRGLSAGKWTEIFVDIKNDENQYFDSLDIYFGNVNRSSNIYFDDLKVFVNRGEQQ